MSRWIFWTATGFGVGKFPIAPGTAGSLLGLAFVLILRPVPPLLYLFITLVLLSLGWYCAGRMEEETGKKDHSEIIVDEVVGMIIAAFLIPPGMGFFIAAFFLFRLLDIFKPFPARWIDQSVPGGAGVMLDDVVAGVYTNLILQGVGRMLIAQAG